MSADYRQQQEQDEYEQWLLFKEKNDADQESGTQESEAQDGHIRAKWERQDL
jgi:hypothetical protein